MVKTFDNIWEDAEKLLEQETSHSSTSQLIKECIAKLSMLDSLSSLENTMPTEDLLRLKSHAMGKVLLVLTQISMKDNINVYTALRDVIENRKISLLEEKYK